MTTNEELNNVFLEAVKTGDAKKLNNNAELTNDILKINRKKGLSSFIFSIFLAILSIGFIILLCSGIIGGFIIINVFMFILPFSPFIVLFLNYKSNKKVKNGNYSAYICEISEVDKNYGYIKGVPKKILVGGVEILISSNIKGINIGDKVLAIIIGNDFYTVSYDKKYNYV